MPARIRSILFPEGRSKCLTLSYDDGTIHDRKLVEIMNKYGIRGTFHINAGVFDQGRHIAESEVKDLYKGHEISAHGFTHASLAVIPEEAVICEIIEDRKKLEELAGYLVCGMSYACGSYNQNVVNILKKLGIRYARTVVATDNFKLPEDPLMWHPTCHHNRMLEKIAPFLEIPDKRLSLLYVWGHSYEFNNNNNWNEIEEFCKAMGNNEKIWYATNMEIIDYIESCHRLRFSADSTIVYNPSANAIWLWVDESIVNIKPGETKLLA